MKSNMDKTNRQYYLDWLRIINILLVFLYHSLHFFDTNDWSVKNPTTYSWVSSMLQLLDIWVMPLIFLISGASIYFAVQNGNVKRFIADKALRLMVPQIIGVFTFSIMQVYIERVTHNQFKGSFFDFLPHYFDGIYSLGGTGNFAFHGMHLWYLLFLFIFILLFLPLFLWLKGKNEGQLLLKLGGFLSKPGALFIIIIPTLIVQNLNIDIIKNGGWGILHYPWFFVAGFLLMSSEKIKERIIKMRWICLAVLTILSGIFVLVGDGPGDHPDILVWFTIFSILGFAMKHLDFNNSFLKYSNEAVMPFYILHQNLLLLLGFFIVKLPLNDPLKFIFITFSTFSIILVLYEFFIRRNNILRVIFGMKPLAKSMDTHRYSSGKPEEL